MKQNVCAKNLRPISDTLEIVGGKWKLLILSTFLTEGTMRFRELQRAIGGITPRMLSKELKDLEQNELITRQVLATTPVTVEYSLTEHGRSLDSVMTALTEWGLLHRTRIMSGQLVTQEH